MLHTENKKAHAVRIRRHRSVSSRPPVSPYGTRLRLGEYFADLVPDGSGPSPVYHWIVQRQGSPEVVNMGQEFTFSAALEQGHRCLESLMKRKRSKRRYALYEFGLQR